MNRLMIAKGTLVSLCITLLIMGSVSAVAISPEKITPEELVAKHLESIGSAEARAKIKSYVIQGSVIATVRIGGNGQSKGGAVLASQGRMSLIGLIFGNDEYSNEKVAYNGRVLQLGDWRPGVRTNLGGFLLNHDAILKEGLLGGALSAAWPLLDLSARNPKLKYAGTKKIDDRETHVLKYEPKDGSNVEIKLYFDAETFRHVRTEYTQNFPPPPVNRPQDAARQKETHLELLEEFSEFKTEGGLTLPHRYKLQLTFDRSNNPILQDWVLTLTQFVMNRSIEEKQFEINAK